MTREGPVSEDLRARIMAAADRLRYRPNLAARALASRRSGLVGMVIDDLGDAILSGIVQAAQGSLERRGYGTLVALNPGREGTTGPIDSLLARGAEAVLFAGRSPTPIEVEALGAKGLPWIALCEDQGDDASIWDAGRGRGAELACRYLLDLGHERLGALLGGQGASRLAESLAKAGSPVTLAEVAPEEDPSAIRSAVRSLLDLPGAPTAIVCRSDRCALIALRECASRGVRIPQDLSVVGFGDEPFARYCHPALTTIRVAAGEIGRQSGDALAGRIAGASTERHAAGVKVIVRETTGPR